jgi:hypothetical protein
VPYQIADFRQPLARPPSYNFSPDLDGLRARLATADAEYEREGERAARALRAKAEAAHEQAVLRAAQEIAAAEGVPLRDALRNVGHTPGEFVALRSAIADVEDARLGAQRAAAFRRWERDQGYLEVPGPSDLAVEVAARTSSPDESAEAVGKGVRARWLRRQYREQR